MGDVQERALALFEARRTRRPIEPFTDADPTLDMQDGYAVQAALTELLLADGDSVTGYKVGLTSKAMQTMIGVDTPDYGPVLASTLYADGADVSMAGFISPKLEAEIGFVLGAPLGAGTTRDQAAAAITGACASLEIVDSRFVDWRIKLADTVADLASNGAAVVSRTVVPVDDIDVRLIGMMLQRDGEVIDSGAGAALGDPIGVVAWLARTLASVGLELEAGHVVLTGALHAAVPMRAGETYRAEFDRLGAVTLHITD